MKKNIFQNLSFILGIIVMIVGFAAVVLWESYGKEAFLYSEVLIVNTDVQKGTIIEESMLKVAKMDQNNVISGAVENSSDIVGLEAKQYLPKNTQVHESFFDTPGTVLGTDQYIFKVPSDWIIAVPSSIRRKDTAIFYAVDSGVASSVALASSEEAKPGSSEIPVNNYDISNDRAYIKSLKESGKEVVQAVVAYVKDSANREVVTLSSDDRYDGSSQVASIEIIIDAQKLNALESSVSNGCRFLVLYNN